MPDDPIDIYQRNLSASSPILLDREYKKPKVEKMLAVLRAANLLPDAPENHFAADIGCSRGFFAAGLSPYFERVFGLDIDENAIRIAAAESERDNLHYILSDSQSLPFQDNQVDLVVCNHVYEHVPSANLLMEEIHRVLKPGGACYFGAASRLIIMEPHYHLPFLSWLPKSIAHRYMRAFDRGTHYYENLRTRRGMDDLFSPFEVTDYTIPILRNPEKFHARDMIPEGSWIERTPLWVWKACYRILPTYIVILRKRGGQ